MPAPLKTDAEKAVSIQIAATANVPAFEVRQHGFHSEIYMDGALKEIIAWDCRDNGDCARANTLVRGWLRLYRENALRDGNADAYNAAHLQLTGKAA